MHANENSILRLASVNAITGIARSTIYKLMSEGSFPRPIKLTSRAVGWRRGDIEAWLDARAQSAL